MWIQILNQYFYSQKKKKLRIIFIAMWSKHLKMCAKKSKRHIFKIWGTDGVYRKHEAIQGTDVETRIKRWWLITNEYFQGGFIQTLSAWIEEQKGIRAEYILNISQVTFFTCLYAHASRRFYPSIFLEISKTLYGSCPNNWT